jgi:SAM-dependent methyltransferase
MRSQFLKLMKCPYCGSDFEIEDVIEQKDDELIAGCVKCACSEFPILEGILILKGGPLSRHIVSLIKGGRVEEATIRCLGWDDYQKIYESYVPFPFSKKIQFALVRILFGLEYLEVNRTYRELYIRYHDNSLPFYRVLGKSLSEIWIKNRFSSEVLWSLYPFIPLLKRKKTRILELGCGMGHGSFVVSKHIGPQQQCCADLLFKRLYLARKYFVQGAEFVCLDANYPLPFKDRIFDSILMSDAFHYVYCRASLAREMERALLPGGLILLMHLHNSLVEHESSSYSLTPEKYALLFGVGQLEVKVMPERKIIENFLLVNELDLVENCSKTELDSANAIILLATSDKSLLRVYDEVNRDFLSAKSNLIINTFYEMKEKGDLILLERSFQYSLGDSYSLTEMYLPKKYEISKEFVSGRHVHISDLEKVEDLMKKFVIINVPENYI